jgi:hypothetical protein
MLRMRVIFSFEAEVAGKVEVGRHRGCAISIIALG